MKERNLLLTVLEAWKSKDKGPAFSEDFILYYPMAEGRTGEHTQERASGKEAEPILYKDATPTIMNAFLT
jgi:hypothetical protein